MSLYGDQNNSSKGLDVKIWIDADACPKPIKELLYRLAERKKILLTLVANRSLSYPASLWIRSIQVASGADVADQEIIRMLEPGDLVVTADIPLADRVITKKALALDHRGKFFSAENIKQSLAMRNLMQEILDSGEITKGPPPFGAKNVQQFANQLDKFLTR